MPPVSRVRCWAESTPREPQAAVSLARALLHGAGSSAFTPLLRVPHASDHLSQENGRDVFVKTSGSFYLRGRETERYKETNGSWGLVHFPDVCSSQKAGTRSWSPIGWQGPKYSSHRLPPPRVRSSRMLDLERRSGACGGTVLGALAVRAAAVVPQHPPLWEILTKLFNRQRIRKSASGGSKR